MASKLGTALLAITIVCQMTSEVRAACADTALIANGIHGTTAADGKTPRWRFIVTNLEPGGPQWGRCDLLFDATAKVITADIGTQSNCADGAGNELAVRGGRLHVDAYCQIGGFLRLRQTVSPGVFKYLQLNMAIGQIALDSNIVNAAGNSVETAADWTPIGGTTQPMTFMGTRGPDRYTLP